MHAQSIIRWLPLIALLWLAAWQDWRSRRVPNWISFGLILGGLMLSWMPWGHLPPRQAFAGFALGFALTFVLYVLKAFGAGDVKLVAGVGACLGPLPVLLIFAGAALIGMVLAIGVSARQGRLVQLFRDGLLLGASTASGSTAAVTSIAVAREGQSMRSRTLPFAVAIALATTTLLMWRGLAGR